MNTSHVVLVMGPSGSGKSTLGAALAKELRAAFIDADDFCPPAARTKMSAGIPLDDSDRAPWLHLLNARLHAHSEPLIVLACSAHKESYRRLLFARLSFPPHIIYLSGPPELIRQRMVQRIHPFMPPALLDSQLALMEKPARCYCPDITRPIDEIVQDAANFVLYQIRTT